MSEFLNLKLEPFKPSPVVAALSRLNQKHFECYRFAPSATLQELLDKYGKGGVR